MHKSQERHYYENALFNLRYVLQLPFFLLGKKKNHIQDKNYASFLTFISCLTLGLSLKRSIIFFTYKIKSMPWLLQGSKDIIDIKRQALHPADNVGVVFFFFSFFFF